MKLVKRLYLLMLLILGGIACGTPGDVSEIKVVGGRQPVEDDPILKHLVRLELLKTTGESGICTGVLISKVHVLTAAHCVKDTSLIAAMFGLKFESASDVSEENIRVSMWSHAHDFLDVTSNPEVMKEAIENKTKIKDIAVVRLNDEAPAGYEPVSLEDMKATVALDLKGAKMLGAGYGADRLPRADREELAKRRKAFEESTEEPSSSSEENLVKSGPMTLEQVKELERKQALPKDDLEEPAPEEEEEKINVGNLMVLDKVYTVGVWDEVGEFIVANPIERDRAICVGDSGGPIFAKAETRKAPSLFESLFGGATEEVVESKWILAGVASRSNCEDLSIYTDARAYLDWIETVAIPKVDEAYEQSKKAKEQGGVLAPAQISIDFDDLDLGNEVP